MQQNGANTWAECAAVALTDAFFSTAEEALFDEFSAEGYIIRDVEDREALDEMRREIVAIVATLLGKPTPSDPGLFLDTIHDVVTVPQLNELRLATYRAINEKAWLRPTYFKLGRGIIESLVGNELAMQNRVNLSIQMPHDDSSLLDLHADVFGGETPFQIVEWVPLVDCHATKSMFILPHAKTKAVMPRVTELGAGGMAKLFGMVERDLIWLNVPYGKTLIFSPNCLHGNVINRVETTRWSMNCRFTGLFTPYTSFEKKIGSYYLPITTRPVSRIGMAYRPPSGFQE
jgi:sporadic carbohydrate cluster 2OG-Fe(II) oxygenase